MDYAIYTSSKMIEGAVVMVYESTRDDGAKRKSFFDPVANRYVSKSYRANGTCTSTLKAKDRQEQIKDWINEVKAAMSK